MSNRQFELLKDRLFWKDYDLIPHTMRIIVNQGLGQAEDVHDLLEQHKTDIIRALISFIKNSNASDPRKIVIRSLDFLEMQNCRWPELALMRQRIANS